MKTPRRTFLKQAAVATLSAPFILHSARAREGEARKLGFALVGLGGLSTHQIAPALQKTSHCRLAAIVTGTPEKAKAWKAKYNLPDRCIYTYDTMDRMAGNPDIDVVYVVTPNALHAEHTIKAAQAGKHVLCEKPMEVSSRKCQDMIDACKRAGRQLAIGYRCRFEPHHQECMRLAKEKVFGDLKIIEAGFGFRIGDPNQWRLKYQLAGGGALMDVGIYAVQASRFLAGQEPMHVSALETKTDPIKFKEVDESIAWMMKFPNGTIAYCSTSYNVNGINRYTAYADNGWFGLDPAYSYSGIKGQRSDREPLNFEQVDHFAAEMDDFAQCIIDYRPSRVSGEEGLRDLRVLSAIYESIAKNGKAIQLT